MKSEKEIDNKLKELQTYIGRSEPRDNYLSDKGSCDALLWVLEREGITLPNRN
jgi:hypothetical protein